MTTPLRDPLYVCGHDARELDRLAVQASIFAEITRDLFLRAGLAPGMRVLDLGCGAGDVTLLAARIVGPTGLVIGVDRAGAPLALARQRAAAAGALTRFVESSIEALALDEPVDAVVGRFVLMHQRDPAATLRRAASHVRAGGRVALVESHMRGAVAGVHSCPHSPAYDRILSWILGTLDAAGAHTDMGLRLPGTFRDAGLAEPSVALHGHVDARSPSVLASFIVDSVRSIRQLADELGRDPMSDNQLDALESALIDDVARGAVLVSPLVVTAWCRVA